MRQKINSDKCFLVRMCYSASNRGQPLFARRFFNQYVEAKDASEVQFIALRVVAKNISENFRIPIGNVNITQKGTAIVIESKEYKCAASKMRAQKKLEKQQQKNGPFQMKLPFCG